MEKQINQHTEYQKRMEDKKTLVSIITITYNSEKTIKSTIESILNQSYPNIEYILVDGKSDDGTLDIMDSYASRFKKKGIVTKIISEKDVGIADAWNKGLKRATGDIIGLLNSDDWYDNDSVAIAVEALDVSKKQISYGVCKKVGANEEIIHVMEKSFAPGRVYLNFGFSHTTCFVTKRSYEAVGHFDIRYKIAMDVDFLLRSVRRGVEFLKTDAVTFMRMGGISTANRRRALKEYQHALKKNGYNPLLIGIFGFLKRLILFVK